MPVMLDAKDHAILDILASDGRASIAEIVERVGLSKTPVQARIKRMEANGVIRGYRAMIDPAKTGSAHLAFVQVTLNDTRKAALDAFNRAARDVPEIEACHMIAGSFDYLLKVRTEDIASYRRLLGETLSGMPHVASSSTFVVMEAVKETG